MRTPYHGVFEPFELRSNVIFFHDWRYVYHGGASWRTTAWEGRRLFTLDPVPEMQWGANDTPVGIRLRAMPAVKTAPFLSPEMPWEGCIHAPTAIRENGRYRLWYEVVSPAAIAAGDPGHANLLCCAESDDAMTWQRLSPGVTGYEGVQDTNIVYGGALSAKWGYHGGTPFVDPSAPAEERYKVFHLGFISPEDLEAYKKERPDDVDPHENRMEKPQALCGAVSPDGLHWTALPDPLVAQVSDTQNICYYDEFLKKYVAYFRTWIMGRRAIGRSQSDTFRRFPLPETILWPDAGVGPSDLWYANAKTAYPGASDHHLLFPKRWHLVTDRFYVHVMTSPDGILWGFPPESQVLAPGERGAWDTGGVSLGCGMVELPGDRVGVPYVGFRIPHKYTRRPPLGEFAWATWAKDRLVALEAKERGEFRTMSVIFKGNELRLNVRTCHAGEVRVEVLGPDGVLPGRSFDDCDAVNGDFLDRPVTWKGDATIPRKPDDPMTFRVRMSAAELFSMRFA